ncbi:MAG: GAF domain-containing protein [Chitinivibrionia bacterium]|nr:GAF domain-containing protein [Chitinivibrionia bacterium]
MNDPTAQAASLLSEEPKNHECPPALLQLACSMLQANDLDEMVSVLMRELRAMLAFDCASIALLTRGKDALIVRRIRDTDDPGIRVRPDGKPAPLEDANIMGWVALNREPLVRNDIESDGRFGGVAGEGSPLSDAAVPLMLRGELLGVLAVESRRKSAFSDADVEILKACGGFACLSIRHARLEQEARELGELCRVLKENVNDLVMLVDAKTGKIVDGNEKSTSVLGYTREELLGTSYIQLFGHEDLYQARKDLINILSNKAHSFANRRMAGRDARAATVDISASPVTIGGEWFITIIAHDISLRKTLEGEIVSQNQRLHQANRKLREVDRMKTEFLANISHELRTPLSIILAYSESIRDESISPDDRNRFIDVISENGETLLSLINNLLDLSKLEISGAMLNITLSHIHDVIRSVWPQMEAAANAKGISISFAPGDSIPVMYLDTVQIKKVISCLIHNAVKFTDGGGSVRVATSLKDEEVIIKVVDTGMGIPFEAIPHIFAMFHQVDGSSSRKCGGMGIGLALAKHIVALHKGKLWVESEVGKGSEFTVSLPLDTEEELCAGEACSMPEEVPVCR